MKVAKRHVKIFTEQQQRSYADGAWSPWTSNSKSVEDQAEEWSGENPVVLLSATPTINYTTNEVGGRTVRAKFSQLAVIYISEADYIGEQSSTSPTSEKVEEAEVENVEAQKMSEEDILGGF
jgi:hypothetical protein